MTCEVQVDAHLDRRLLMLTPRAASVINKACDSKIARRVETVGALRELAQGLRFVLEKDIVVTLTGVLARSPMSFAAGALRAEIRFQAPPTANTPVRVAVDRHGWIIGGATTLASLILKTKFDTEEERSVSQELTAPVHVFDFSDEEIKAACSITNGRLAELSQFNGSLDHALGAGADARAKVAALSSFIGEGFRYVDIPTVECTTSEANAKSVAGIILQAAMRETSVGPNVGAPVVLDPCFGIGTVITELARGAVVRGTEVDEARAKAAKHNMQLAGVSFTEEHLICGKFEDNFRRTRGTYGIQWAWINWPWDGLTRTMQHYRIMSKDMRSVIKRVKTKLKTPMAIAVPLKTKLDCLEEFLGFQRLKWVNLPGMKVALTSSLAESYVLSKRFGGFSTAIASRIRRTNIDESTPLFIYGPRAMDLALSVGLVTGFAKVVAHEPRTTTKRHAVERHQELQRSVGAYDAPELDVVLSGAARFDLEVVQALEYVIMAVNAKSGVNTELLDALPIGATVFVVNVEVQLKKHTCFPAIVREPWKKLKLDYTTMVHTIRKYEQE